MAKSKKPDMSKLDDLGDLLLINGGKLADDFQASMAEMIVDLADFSLDPAKRVVAIGVTVRPVIDKDSASCLGFAVCIECSSKLPGRRKSSYMMQVDTGQMTLNFNESDDAMDDGSTPATAVGKIAKGG